MMMNQKITTYSPSLVDCGTGLQIEVCHVFRTRRGELRSGNTKKLLTHFLMASKTHVLFRVPYLPSSGFLAKTAAGKNERNHSRDLFQMGWTVRKKIKCSLMHGYGYH